MDSQLSVAQPGASTQNALQVLRADHRQIGALLDDLGRVAADALTSPADRSGLLARLGALLGSHMQMEQELFYPVLAVNGASADTERALDEHDELRVLLQGVAAPELAAATFAERLAMLDRTLRAHVQHEEHALFEQASGLDLEALGTRMALRRAQLLGDQGVD